MGYMIGRRYKVGGGSTGKPRLHIAEITVGSAKFLIRQDKSGFAAVVVGDEWGNPIVEGATIFDVADALSIHVKLKA